MKRFILMIILILNLQSWTRADDISDFEIEGMSIGDSALDYFSEDYLNKAEKFYYPNKKFYELFTHSSKFKVYDSVTLSFKPNNYTIYGISGALDFRSKSFDECLNKKKDIEKEIEAIFQDSQKKDHGIYLTPDYTDNKSKRSQVEYILKGSEEIISVECVNWSEKTEKKQDWGDNLSITLYSKEYEEFARGL